MDLFSTKVKRFIALFEIAFKIFAVIVIMFCVYLVFAPSDDESIDMAEEDGTEEAVCNVNGFELYGGVVTHVDQENLSDSGNYMYDMAASEDFIVFVDETNNDDTIKALWVEVDSYGGSPAAAEEIAAAVAHSEKPVIAYVRSAALSAAYWAISGADHIVAVSSADIGSIGVTSSYLDYTQQNYNEGLRYVQLSTGKYKDMSDPDKPYTNEEKQLVMRDANIIYENFMKAISENRGMELEKVKVLADGSTMLAQQALENKLIDQVGTYYDAKDYLKELIGEKVEICW